MTKTTLLEILGKLSFELTQTVKEPGVLEQYLYYIEQGKTALHLMGEDHLEAMNRATQYREALDQHCIVSMTDVSGTILYANQQFVEISGYSLSELIGSNHRLIRSDHHSKDFFRELWRTISAGRVFHGEICNRRKDGSLYWVYSTILPILNTSAEPLAYISVRTDITLIKEQTHRLELMRDSLHKALRREIDFMALVSHELRTPLTGILGISELMLCDSTLGAEHRESLKIIEKCGENLLRIINDLLNYSRLQNQHRYSARHSFTLYNCLQPLLEVYQKQADLKKIDFQVAQDLKQFDLSIYSDMAMFQEILSNLLDNAVRFTNQGRVSLEIECSELDEHLARVRFRVSDTGPGMDEETLCRIQQSFSQSLDYKRRTYGGLGLGLCIARELSTQLGGELSLQSAPMQGTVAEFRVIVPLEPQNHEPDKRKLNPQFLRVLVVEDHALHRRKMLEALRAFGCPVDMAFTSSEAIARAKAHAFDLIFIDIDLAITNGFETAVLLREALDSDSLPCLVGICDKVTDEILQKCKFFAFDEVMSRPPTRGLLAELFQKLFVGDRQNQA